MAIRKASRQYNSDYMSRLCDDELEQLEERLTALYANATNDVLSDYKKWMDRYEGKYELMVGKLETGEINESEFKEWVNRRMVDNKLFTETVNSMTDVLVNTDMVAMALVNDELPLIIAQSYNFVQSLGFAAADEAGLSVGTFQIYNARTVQALIKDNPDILKYVNKEKDYTFNKDRINNAITHSILNGDSIQKTANRLQGVSSMDENSAIRAARTAMTAAENLGRNESFHDLKEKGIPARFQWSATHDNRTRDTHILLDGQFQDEDGYFRVEGYEIQYPGDPAAEPEMIYNCRCRASLRLEGVDHSQDGDLYEQFMKENYPDDWNNIKNGIEKKEEAFQKNKEGAAERVEARREKLEEQKTEDNNNVTEMPKYQSAEELEKAIMEDGGKLDDDRLLAYSNTLEEEMAYNASLKNNLEQAINENGYTEGIKTAIEAEEKEVRQALENMPEMKTPEQIAQEEALNERLDILSSLKQEEGTEEIQELEENINVSESKIDEDKSLLTSEEKQEILEIPDEARKEIDRFEKKNMDKKNEYSMVVDANGNIIGEAGGKKTSTHLTEGENLASEGNYHIHNHPLGDVIYSDQDIRNYEYYGVRGGLVITKDGTEYELINMDPVSKVKEAEELKHEFLYGDMTEKEYNEKMNELLPFSSEVSSNFDRIETEWRDERREKLDQLYGQYGRENREMVNKMYDQWKESVGDDNARKAKWLEDNAEKYGFVFGKRKVK